MNLHTATLVCYLVLRTKFCSYTLNITNQCFNEFNAKWLHD
uniref:Uncharacterized protein n=1 Tax=Zea mays TaxID=4577 RepID=C0PJR2_MAIZE|nr:unknown [Zea mays]